MIASVISNQDIKLMTESLSKEEAIFAQVNAEKLILTGANKRETYIINLTKSPRSSLKSAIEKLSIKPFIALNAKETMKWFIKSFDSAPGEW
jgi:hypothetical protein